LPSTFAHRESFSAKSLMQRRCLLSKDASTAGTTIGRQSVMPLSRDSSLPEWPVRPWLFVREDHLPLLLKALGQIGKGEALRFRPRITTLEMVQPWRYRSWGRVGEEEKPEIVPETMRT